MITYFIACIFYYISLESDEHENLNEPKHVELIPQQDEEDVKRTFINIYFIQRLIWENSERFIISLYFALTTLSTVGYGDYYPVS
tara:strand:+ start:923 stop:1177 length:255 start_codon:yes stop_codon:yes gene_type:complete